MRKKKWNGIGARIFGLTLGCGLAAVAVVAIRTVRAEGSGVSGQLEVRRVEVGYVLKAGSLKTRVHLVNGLAVDFETKDGGDIDRILNMTRLFAEGRAKMAAELRGGEVVALDLAVGPSPR